MMHVEIVQVYAQLELFDCKGNKNGDPPSPGRNPFNPGFCCSPLYTGHGSVLNVNGDIEMDAFIMEGAELKTGAVTCVTNIKHPVSLARMVMEKVNYALHIMDNISFQINSDDDSIWWCFFDF